LKVKKKKKKYLKILKAKGKHKRFILNILIRLDRGYGCDDLEPPANKQLMKTFKEVSEWFNKNDILFPFEYLVKQQNLDLLFPEKLQYNSYSTSKTRQTYAQSVSSIQTQRSQLHETILN
jgi:hypothetical protein